MTRRVELHPALFFVCDECGRDSFIRAPRPVLTDEERVELAQDHGIDPWSPVEMFSQPTVVTCDHCGEEFGTE